jgi:DNA-binding beta-propeller fold protein YncE
MRAWLYLALCLGSLSVPAQAEEVQPYLRIESGTHTAAIRALATDRRGETLLSASEDKTARLWRVADQQLLTVLRPPIGAGNDGKLYAAALTPDGRVAAVAGWSADNDVYLFDARSGQMRARISGLPNVVNQLAFSPDGTRLAVLLWGGHGVQLYASQDGWLRFTQAGGDPAYGGDAYGAAFSPDGQQLLTSAYDGALRLYALRGASLWLQRKIDMGAGSRPHGLAYAPDGRSVAVGFADQPLVRVLRTDSFAPEWQPGLQGMAQGGLQSVAWSADGHALYAGGTWRSAPARHAVRRWTHDGALQDLPTASDAVTALLPLGGARVAWASGDASWGVLGGASVHALRADYRALSGLTAPLRLSDNAHELGFGTAYGGADGARFDLDGPTWRAPLATARAEPASTLDLRDWQDSSSPRLRGQPLALEPGEVSLARGLDPGGRAFALGSNFLLRLYAADGRLLWRTETPAPCFAVQLSADQRWVVAGFGDGTLRWFRRSDGAETLALYPHADHKAWAAWTPDGRFAAGGGGEQKVGWHLNRGPDQAAEFLPLARFSERYFDPLGVLTSIGDQPQHRPVADLRQGLALPPAVRITGPANGSPVPDAPLRVDVSVQDRGGGIDEVRLLNNGKVIDSAAPAKTGTVHVAFDVALEGGRNELKAVAFDRDRTESAAAVVTVQAPPPPTRPQLHVLAVGVNSYRNSQLNLSFSVPDARGVADLFRSVSPRLFSGVDVDELYDGQATRAGVLARLAALRSTRTDDVVVVYLAGHGETLGDEWYFIPNDLTQPERNERLVSDGVSSHELAAALKAMPARKVVILIDACKSGAAIAGFRGLEERRVLAQLSRASGTHLIAATSKEQSATELQLLGHGVFTYALLEGLSGKAAADGVDVTARKLMVYVEQALPELSRRYRTEEQFPVVSSTGMDFPLVVR